MAVEDTVSHYYLRLQADARPGVLAQISQVLAEQEIGIISVLQPDEREGDEEDTAQLILMLHEARFGDMCAAKEKLGQLECIQTSPTLFRVETF